MYVPSEPLTIARFNVNLTANNSLATRSYQKLKQK